MAEEFSLSHQQENDVLIIRTNGYLNDLGAEKVDTICTESLKKGVKKIVINLEKSPLINSIGISILIGVIEAIEELEGKLAFTNLTPTNKKTFEMMGLLQFAQAFDAETEAVKAFKGGV
ncbi:MAG: STAS domain-containing protein [Candidatus Riflebacteria bacterium]|nr:STAS domain-containing protein [Candidatus Riflebacteria bacterium]